MTGGHVINVINMQYNATLCVLQKINQKQQIGTDKPQWKKVKFSFFVPSFSLKRLHKR